MGEAMWWWMALAVLVAAGGVAWRMMRQRGRGAATGGPGAAGAQSPAPSAATPPALAPSAPVPPVAQAPLAQETRPAAPPPAAPPRAPGPAVSAEPVAPMPKAAAAERVVERAPVRPALPQLPRFELRDAGRQPVLVVERADGSAWRAAAELASTPVQREQLARLLAHAPQLVAAHTDDAATYAVRLRAATALPLARGEIAGSALSAVPTGAFDADAAADFAAVLLALHAARGPLPALRAQVGEAKTVVAALHPKLVAQTDGRAKTLVQDLARYLREAEENYAGAIRKPVFLDRVGQACALAAGLWQALQAPAAAARSTLQAQAQAPRFGEVQLERSVAALRELAGQRRLLDAAARLLSGWAQLRLLLGQRDADSAGPLADATRALDDAMAADRALLTLLGASLERAKAPDYVGKAEFTTHLHAARELVAALEQDALVGATAALARARAEFAAPRADEAALALLLQLDAQGRVTAVREPTSPAAR